MRVHNDAELGSKTLIKCMSQLQRILVIAGASVDVRICQSAAERSCEYSSENRKVVDVRILSGVAKNEKHSGRPPLGQSIVGETGGVYAVIFLASVQQQAAASDVPWPVLLAYATAHEIGHLLLGADAHAASGVMKGNWDAKDMRAMFQNSVHFNSEQQRMIAHCCG